MVLWPLAVLATIFIVLCIFGWVEYRSHQTALAALPLRIHVNGTRGKSSVTRLIAAGLRAGGIRTMAKTTGTAPRIIDKEGRDRIIHRLRSASIGEQVRLMRFFAREKPEAVVIECMAVQPQYQWISEHKMIKSHMGVITNIRPDHVDEMGPTIEDITRSLCNTVPVKGKLFTAEADMQSIMKEITTIRKSEFIWADEKEISASVLDRFKYLEHPQNIAVAMKVCEALGIERQTALQGMETVEPDLGALNVWQLKFGDKTMTFINGMAANDPVSTLRIWHFIIDRYPSEGDICVFLNTREDRRTRSRQLLQLLFDEIKPNRAVIRGDNLDQSIRHYHKSSPETGVSTVGLKKPFQHIIDEFSTLNADSLIFAMGNQVGDGQAIINLIRSVRHDG